MREVSQAGWVCTSPVPCEYSVTLNGDASTGAVFGNYQLKPSILLDKTGPATAEAGSLVPYTINITNNGDLPLSSVVVTDPLCTAAPTLVSKNGDLSPDTLDPAVDQWTYTCSVQTTVGQTSVDNVANVTAKDEFDTTVTSTDNAVTTLSQPVPVTDPVQPPPALAPPVVEPAPVTGSAVLAETAPPAARAAAAVSPSARLLRPTRCASRPFTATVIGRRIARVRFYVDGKLVATLRRANGDRRALGDAHQPGALPHRQQPPPRRADPVHRVGEPAAERAVLRVQPLRRGRTGTGVHRLTPGSKIG